MNRNPSQVVIDLDYDLERIKCFYEKSKSKKAKQAYYKLWYLILVMKHGEYL